MLRPMDSLLLKFRGLRQELGIKTLGQLHELSVVDFGLGFELGVMLGGQPKSIDALQGHDDKKPNYRNARVHFDVPVAFVRRCGGV